ncbi:MAG: general secretion pathway protein GspK [Hydrogenothermaceae bacterium]|nr:general secretion pathway protein GspK [Hydrogenothermaceae bacterium]
MIIVLVLMMFMSFSYYVVDTYSRVNSANRIVVSVYQKQQAYYVASSVFEVVKLLLEIDDKTVDTLKDSWANPLNFEKDGVKVEVTIYDENRYVNLNGVKDPHYRKVVENLFTNLNISPSYLERLLVWVGKKDGYISDRYPPKKKDLDSLYELQFIGLKDEDMLGKMVSNTFYPGLLSTSTVYTQGRININTAPIWVLMSLDEKINQPLASKIVDHRSKNPFKTVNDLVLVEGFNFDILYRIQNFIDVKSDVFHIRIKVFVGDTLMQVDYVYSRSSKQVLYVEII